MSLLRHALLPNLVQTTEGQPVIVHTGPFGNIAHGCSSVVGDRLALSYADYVLTEAGFGADLGFEKFMHIKARTSGLNPQGAVIVATIKALKYHGGVKARDLDPPNPAAVESGLENLMHLIGVIRSFGLPVVVALNRFPTDTPEELRIARLGSERAGAAATVESSPFTDGGSGCRDLAEALIAATGDSTRADDPVIDYAYDLSDSLEDKVLALARRVYNAGRRNLEPSRAKATAAVSVSWDGTTCPCAWPKRTFRSATGRHSRDGPPATPSRSATYGRPWAQGSYTRSRGT